MREFRLTFAQHDSGGIVRPDVANALGKRLAATYGGFTRFDAQGGYVMADGRLVMESVFVFDVAANDADNAESILQYASMAAAEIRRAMDQESVYFRNIDGRVHILKADKPRATSWQSFAELDRNYSNATARPERTAADGNKPPETLTERAAKLREIAESMVAADKRRGGGDYGTAADILATAADLYQA